MDVVTAAARNNASWCDAVCRSLGLPARRRPGTWEAGGPPPPFYPDRITLARGLSAAVVLEGVPEDAACAVKDSFGDLDLAGFTRLFEASWIARRPRGGRPTGLTWSVIRTAEELAAWADAVGSPGGFGPALLADDSVRLLHLRGGGAVAALNTSDDVVGISNVVAAGADEDQVWAGVAAMMDEEFPERLQVGYERGNDLAAALRAGFEVLGPLRVWDRRAPG
ncbi:UNVERIFIED_ORG: hypothetical protein E4P37_07335 [Bacillus sp. AZ43]